MKYSGQKKRLILHLPGGGQNHRPSDRVVDIRRRGGALAELAPVFGSREGKAFQ
jgi:hypothetical protein